MANQVWLTVNWKGWGTWNKSYNPTSDAFVTELNRLGWAVSNFILTPVGDNNYAFLFTTRLKGTGTSAMVNNNLTELQSYLGYYFDNLNIVSTGTSIEPLSSNTTINNNTNGNTNAIANSADMQTLLAALGNLGKMSTPASTGALNKVSSSLGISTGAVLTLAIVGVAFLFLRK